jgi:hypothetical protein
MSKWADYLVTGVKHDFRTGSIVEFEVRPDLGSQVGGPLRASRSWVVNAIESGVTFVTVYSQNGKFHRGEDVRVVKIGLQKYLRTDPNGVGVDNLGSLPEVA